MQWDVNLEGLTEVRLGNHKECVTANVPTTVVSFSCSNIITQAKKKKKKLTRDSPATQDFPLQHCYNKILPCLSSYRTPAHWSPGKEP